MTAECNEARFFTTTFTLYRLSHENESEVTDTNVAVVQNAATAFYSSAMSSV